VNQLPEAKPFDVVVADDHELFRDGLRSLVLSMPDARLVGEAADGPEVIALAAALRPEVIVMDIRMPHLDGVEATRRILAENAQIRVLVVSMLDDDASVFAAMRAGARGYVLKGAGHEHVIDAIRSVHRGDAILGAGIAARMARYFAHLTPTVEDAFPELTKTERDILRLLAEGLQNAQIAERLYLAPKTVRNNVSSILTKLNVADRTEAALRARDAGVTRRIRSTPSSPELP
jgi:DNA-binding NarL/FixJ family response regulator